MVVYVCVVNFLVTNLWTFLAMNVTCQHTKGSLYNSEDDEHLRNSKWSLISFAGDVGVNYGKWASYWYMKYNYEKHHMTAIQPAKTSRHSWVYV